jgi:putative membrane protein
MSKFLLRWLVAAIALYAAVRLVPGIAYDGDWTTLAGMALLFGLVNAFVRPFLTLMSCPLIIMTMGVFLLVINGFLMLLAARLAAVFGVGFYVDGFGAAFWGALVVSVVSFFLNLFLRDDGEHKRRPHRD